MTIYNVKDFGAQGDGIADDTAAIQQAINACAAAGGGQVLISAGHVFISSTLMLKSNVELHVERGAVLRGYGTWPAYPAELETQVLSGGLVNEPELPRRAFIIAFEAHNIALTGGGTIDGQGRAFVEQDLGPIYKMRGEQQYRERPFTVFLIGCHNVTVRDLTLHDGAFWTLRLTGCTDVSIHNLRIDNDLKLPNSDGIDLDRCRNVRISDCHIAAGDDAICLKACRGSAAYGPCEAITVTGCTLMSTSSALIIGAECRSPIRNVIFSSCVIQSSHRGLAIHLSEESDVENVLFANMVVETRLFDPMWWGRGEPIYVTAIPWVDRVGRVRRVRFTNIVCRSENGVYIEGWDTDSIDELVLEGVRVEVDKWSKVPGGQHDRRPCQGEGLVTHPTAGFYIKNVSRVTLQNCQVVWGPNRPDYFGAALESENVRTLTIQNFEGVAAIDAP